MFFKQERLKYGFVALMFSFMFLLVLPAYWVSEDRNLVRGLLLILTILLSLNLVLENRRERISALVMAVPSLFLTIGIAADRHWVPSVFLMLCNVLFYAGILTVLLRYIVRSRLVNTNIIAAAVCGYFILGIMWAYIYSVVELMHPGAFSLPPGLLFHESFGTLTYFSFVSLTTVGFGDITPQIDIARSWVILESIVGPFYLTVLVARLVSMYGMHRDQ